MDIYRAPLIFSVQLLSFLIEWERWALAPILANWSTFTNLFPPYFCSFYLHYFFLLNSIKVVLLRTWRIWILLKTNSIIGDNATAHLKRWFGFSPPTKPPLTERFCTSWFWPQKSHQSIFSHFTQLLKTLQELRKLLFASYCQFRGRLFDNFKPLYQPLFFPVLGKILPVLT